MIVIPITTTKLFADSNYILKLNVVVFNFVQSIFIFNWGLWQPNELKKQVKYEFSFSKIFFEKCNIAGEFFLTISLLTSIFGFWYSYTKYVIWIKVLGLWSKVSNLASINVCYL